MRSVCLYTCIMICLLLQTGCSSLPERDLAEGPKRLWNSVTGTAVPAQSVDSAKPVDSASAQPPAGALHVIQPQGQDVEFIASYKKEPLKRFYEQEIVRRRERTRRLEIEARKRFEEAIARRTEFEARMAARKDGPVSAAAAGSIKIRDPEEIFAVGVVRPTEVTVVPVTHTVTKPPTVAAVPPAMIDVRPARTDAPPAKIDVPPARPNVPPTETEQTEDYKIPLFNPYR